MKKQIFALLVAVIALTSCSTHEKCAAYGGYSANYRSDEGGKFKTEETSDNRMMVYNGSMTIESNKPDSVAAQVNTLAKKYNGYVLTSGNNYTTIRIKASDLKSAMAEVAALGKVTSKNISGSDVTEQYTDYSLRLENAERARKRYLELLEKASTVGETLQVEKELERLNGEIELLKGKMARISHLVDYSTLTVYHEEKVKLGVLGYVFVGTYKAIKWLFVRN
jgi:hypothetical protein